MLGAGGRKREEPQRVSLLSLQRPQKATFLLQPLRTPRGFLWDQKKPTHCRETPSIGGGIYPGPLSLGEYISAYSILWSWARREITLTEEIISRKDHTYTVDRHTLRTAFQVFVLSLSSPFISVAQICSLHLYTNYQRL